MTQLIVSLEDNSMLGDIKKAIKLLRGVASVKTYGSTKRKREINAETEEAIREIESGHGIVCDDMESYLNLVRDV